MLGALLDFIEELVSHTSLEQILLYISGMYLYCLWYLNCTVDCLFPLFIKLVFYT